MQIEIRPADSIADAEALSALDRRIFPPGDCFADLTWWGDCECFWIIVDGQPIGSIALGLDMEFSRSWDEDNPSPGSMYLISVGILPEFQKRSFGSVAMQWLIHYARSKGFARISTNCRKGDVGSLRLHKKFGFRVVDEVSDYYRNPVETAVVMQLILHQQQ